MVELACSSDCAKVDTVTRRTWSRSKLVQVGKTWVFDFEVVVMMAVDDIKWHERLLDFVIFEDDDDDEDAGLGMILVPFTLTRQPAQIR
jgi:hypothetical protein